MPKPQQLISRLAKPLALAVFLALLLALILAGRHQEDQPAGDVQKYHQKQFRVYRVIDGDTIDLDTPDGLKPQTRVRLWGIDTPETKAPGKPIAYFGPQATAFTEKMVVGRMVTIELQPEKTRGNFGRLLGFVYTEDNKLLNEELLKTGHAYADGRWKHRFYFRFMQTETQARKNKLGLWEQVQFQDMPRHVQQRLGTAK